MAWFISEIPGLTVQVDPGRAVRFRAAEYRTDDAAEIAALRADPRCVEAGKPAARTIQVEGYAVNLDTMTMHYLPQVGTRCHIPEDVEHVTGWRVYRRMQDALRWQRGVELCGFCMREVDGRR